jgi:tetratricopeptide (TPR) repeat protein
MTLRTQSRFARCWWVLVVAACLLSRGSAVRGADAVSIAELMNAKRKGLWTAYAQSGASMKVEGRYSVFSPTLLRFLNCQDLNFVWYKEDEHFPIETSSVHSRNLEVFGHFEMRSASPVFVVRQFRTLPSDEDSLRERKDSLINSPAAEWYALGKWAAARGAFYGDEALARESQGLYAEALRREEKLLPADDLDGRLALAKKYPQYGQPEDERVQFVQESLTRRWQSLRGAHSTAADLEALSNRINDNLGGCKVPLTGPEEALRDRWSHDPIATYRNAPANERLLLNRMLWIDVRSAYLELWAKERNRDPMQLADRIDREIPEQHFHAEALRGGALDERLADVAHLTRDELLNLADQFQRRGQPEKALAAKRAWVKVKEDRLTKEGRPSDLVQAAHEYQSLLDDNESAARLLLQAAKIAPEMKEVGGQLERLGYKRVNGQWLTAAQAAALPADPVQKAAEAGRYTGMTREQIRKMIGAPDSRTRVVASGRVSEVWIYDQNAKSRVAIHFVGSADGHDVTAVKVVQ